MPSFSSSDTASSHFNIAQKTMAVKKEDKAYTSPSTALYQKESEKQYAKAPTTPAAIMPKVCSPVTTALVFKAILLAKCVILQNKNKMVKPLLRALIRFTPVAACLGSNGIINNRPINTKSGAPGGCGICSL